MATVCMKSIKGRVIRLTRLDACGDPVEGDCTTVVSDGFISVTLSAEVETGEEYLQKNAWGDLCISEKDADRVKWVNATIEFCNIDPDLISVIGGDAVTPIEVGGNVVGYSYGRDGTTEGFALEVWTKLAGQDCDISGDPSWGYFVLPNLRNGRIDGDITIENSALTLSLRGEAFPDVGWGTGPYATNPIGASFPSGDLWAQVVTTEQPPAASCGCVAWAPIP